MLPGSVALGLIFRWYLHILRKESVKILVYSISKSDDAYTGAREPSFF